MAFLWAATSLGFLFLDCRGSWTTPPTALISSTWFRSSGVRLLPVICCSLFYGKPTNVVVFVMKQQSLSTSVCASRLLRKGKMFFWGGFQTSAPGWTEKELLWCPREHSEENPQHKWTFLIQPIISQTFPVQWTPIMHLQYFHCKNRQPTIGKEL